MDFLTGLREAMATGISKEEYLAIWNREIQLKGCTALNKSSEDAAPVDKGGDNCMGKEDPVMSLLVKIVEQQNKTHEQQARIELQLKHLQSAHDKNQHLMQQKIEQSNDIIKGKVLALEAALTNLEQSFTQCVRQAVHSESIHVQEKVLLMTNTVSSLMLQEIRDALRGMAGSASTTLSKADILGQKQVQPKSRLSAETAPTKAQTSINVSGNQTLTDNANNVSVEGEQEKTFLSNTGEAAEGFRKVTSISDSEISYSLRNTLSYELNSFLVRVQKLLLCPLNSEDISFYIIDKMKEIFQQERSITTDQLLNVQTAISSDVHARLYKMETCFRQEVDRTRAHFEHNEKMKGDFGQMIKEMQMLRSFINFELPTRIMANVKLISVSGVESGASGLDERQGGGLEANNDVKSEGLTEANNDVKSEGLTEANNDVKPERLTEANKLGKEKPGEGIHNLDRNNGDSTNLCPETVGSEQVEAMILMFMMYMLTVITYRDALGSETTSVSACQSITSNRDTPYTHLEAKSTSGEPASKEGVAHEVRTPRRDIPEQITEAHLKLILGNYKEAKYLCHLKYEKHSLVENDLNLDDIDPGYNLQLQTKIDEKNILNFFLAARSGKADNSLIWPAEFNITLLLANKKPGASSKQEKWRSFTKQKTLRKPMVSTGYSFPTPFCFFKEEIIDSVIEDDTLVFHITVQFIGEGKAGKRCN